MSSGRLLGRRAAGAGMAVGDAAVPLRATVVQGSKPAL